MSSRPLPPAQKQLRQALKSGGERMLTEVRDALSAGATLNDAIAQRLWLECHVSWSEGMIADLFRTTGLKAVSGLPLAGAVQSQAWVRLEALLDCGLDSSELGGALIAHPDALSAEGVALLDRCLARGFIPSRAQVSFAALDTEDEARALLLASRNHLSVNALCSMKDQGHFLTFAQSALLFGRGMNMSAWLEAGADFSTQLASGLSPANRLMLDVNHSFDSDLPPIPAWRSRTLLELSRRNLVAWLDEDGHGTQPIQAFRALPASNHPLWLELAALAEAQALSGRMERVFPSVSAHTSKLRI